MWQSLHWRNCHQKQSRKTKPCIFTCLYSDFWHFSACAQVWPPSTLEQGEVYWWRPSLVYNLDPIKSRAKPILLSVAGSFFLRGGGVNYMYLWLATAFPFVFVLWHSTEKCSYITVGGIKIIKVWIPIAKKLNNWRMAQRWTAEETTSWQNTEGSKDKNYYSWPPWCKWYLATWIRQPLPKEDKQ